MTADSRKSPRDARLLGLVQVAERLAISIHTVRRWASQGRLPVVRLSSRVLMPEHELESLIERGLEKPRAHLAL